MKGQGEEAQDLPQSPADCAGSASTRQAATEPSAGTREQRHHHIWQPFEVKAFAAVRNGREREPRIYLKVPQTVRAASTEPSAGDEQRRHHIWQPLVAEAVEAVQKGRKRDLIIYLKVPRLGRAARRPLPQCRHLRAERLIVVQKSSAQSRAK